MKIEIEVSEQNEITRSPYWLIINPSQNFKVNDEGIYNIAGMITGLFFSREEAQMYLDKHIYNFSENAKVFCCSSVLHCQYGEKVNF